MKFTLILFISFLILFVEPNTLSSQTQQPQGTKYWVYFKDKGLPTSQSGKLLKGTDLYNKAMAQLTQKAIERRAKVLSPDQLVGAQDLPLNQSYIAAIQNIGGVLHQQVRWMNAASFYLTQTQLLSVSQLPFVESIKPVVRFVRREIPHIEKDNTSVSSKMTQSDYGPSLAQYAAVKIPEVHHIGVTGEGVLIGMLDTGFRWKAHESLKNSKVIAERDFINNDDTTANQPGDPSGQDSHGTLTMSILGSYMPGKIIGPAFQSSFILAKTEYVPTETQIEEDWWVAGIEWMENRGVDVVSSSLGYDIFDGGSGYSWDNGDFNGKTAVTTKAAARAARLGVVVVTAMGNEGNGNGVRGTMLCPADADTILSVGAVTIPGLLASFSSTGPTNDSRIKPDVVTPGVSIYSAQIPGPATYGYSQGTSAATPIAAGVAALLLSARPELTPIQVREALRNNADRVDTTRFLNHPNNFSGWGRVNALRAISHFGPVFSNKPTISFLDSSYEISVKIVSKYGIKPQSVILDYKSNGFAQPNLQMNLVHSLYYPTSGVYSIVIPREQPNSVITFNINAIDSAGKSYKTPRPGSGLLWEFIFGDSTIQPSVAKFELLQNFPNPFKNYTIIYFNAPKQTEGELIVYDLLGRRIKTINKGSFAKGQNIFYWHGTNDDGLLAGSGVYFYRIRTTDFAADRKMLLLR